MKKLKVAVGMSGGVDSGVSAKLLVDAGYDVTGVHLHFWAESGEGVDRQNKCCSTESLMAARRTCDLLGIPFYTFNFEDVFKSSVVEYFLDEYRQNRTPNPCVVCNRKVKTGRLVKYVQGLGFDLLATGHYIKLVESTGDEYREVSYDNLLRRAEILEEYPKHAPLFLKMGEDLKKDQSYFLYTMDQSDLVHLVFPLAGLIKDQTRKLAQEWKLPVASSKESFEICFIPTDDHTEFLGRHLDGKYIQEGDVVTTSGEVIGRHRGLPFYSVGQRRGFTSRKPVPYYVVEKDVEKNLLIVANVLESNRSKFMVENVHWVADARPERLSCDVRLRNMGNMESAEVVMNGMNACVELAQAQRGITPGQSAVFYDRGVILGGGVIREVTKSINAT